MKIRHHRVIKSNKIASQKCYQLPTILIKYRKFRTKNADLLLHYHFNFFLLIIMELK